MDTKLHLAKELYELGSLQVSYDQPFTWTSGILSPVYCDNRLTMSNVKVREQITEYFASYISTYYPDVDVIAGCATAGIPHAAWVSSQLELPMVYVRDKPKGHGKENQIEGRVQEGQKAVVIEDLISTGKSSLNSVRALKQSGVEVVGVIAIFSYGLTTSERAFREENIPYVALTNFEVLLDYMLQANIITKKQHNHLLTFKEDPATFSLTYQQ
ncbi:orotate phosphoribosyltransferase [Pontibacillus yanchengensis]|uniref:Orotate phosphoribosyltransferase n=1 Tax=Pontibacillus yanchengensis Y32 TaxID=1385514 RepID=A0A0A2T7B9_9BACI|nr:orotate phosphoribosyltransferase [Pontibacillus yanchengensis]KGP71384.1 orotate phosphoribosyltransferase [Pontibacillus yanchengensis Y32]